MPTSLDEWFVELGLGVFLGPMPLADLRQLAANGALLESDQVRRGGADDWIVAKEVPGLFELEPDEWISLPDESSLPPWNVTNQLAANMKSASAEEFFEESPDESLTLADCADESITLASETLPSAHRSRAKQKTLGQSTSPPDQQPPKLRPHPMALARPVVREIPPAPLPVTHDFEIAFPPPQPAQSATPVVSQSALARTAESVPTPPSNRPLTIPANHAQNTTDSVESAGTAPRVSSTLSLTRHVSETSPSVRLQPRRTDRSLPSWIKPALIGVAAASTLLLGWFFWPSSEPNIYAEYRAIYDELRRYRTGMGEVDNWSDFVKQARETMESKNSWLERTAKPGDRDKDLLLYVGRDLQSALELAPDAKFQHQERLDGFMSQLHESFGKP